MLVAALATSTAAKVASRRTLLARAGFIHDQVPSIDILAVKRVNGLLRFLSTAHGDEAESSGPLGHLVHDPNWVKSSSSAPSVVWKERLPT